MRTNTTLLTPNQVRDLFRVHGTTISKWARDNGFKPQNVVKVLNGYFKAQHGEAHEIAVLLRLKAKPKKSQVLPSRKVA